MMAKRLYAIVCHCFVQVTRHRYLKINWWHASLKESPQRATPQSEGIRQYDSSDTGHSDNVDIAAEHQEPAEVLSQLDNTSNSPDYGECKCF